MEPAEASGAQSEHLPPTTSGALPDQWNQRRLRLRDWLRTRAPQLEPVYEAAVRMADDQTFPGRVWFVSHAVREIRNRLPDAILGPVVPERVQYSVLASAIRDAWIDSGLPAAGVSPVDAGEELPRAATAAVEVPRQLVDTVADLVAEHERGAETHRQRAARMFGALGDGSAPAYVVRQWMTGTAWGPEFAHVRNDPLDDEVAAGIDTYFNQFESALFALSSYSFENMDEIDALLGSANS